MSSLRVFTSVWMAGPNQSAANNPGSKENSWRSFQDRRRACLVGFDLCLLRRGEGERATKKATSSGKRETKGRRGKITDACRKKRGSQFICEAQRCPPLSLQAVQCPPRKIPLGLFRASSSARNFLSSFRSRVVVPSARRAAVPHARATPNPESRREHPTASLVPARVARRASNTTKFTCDVSSSWMEATRTAARIGCQDALRQSLARSRR